jgi:TolB-like protein/DNA-binding winged helix-turn-helix (wHTH) protein
MNPFNGLQTIVRFGMFEVDLRAGELRKGGMRVRLQAQPFQVLAVLLGHAGQLVTREELCRRVWPQDTFVDFDHALNTAVKKIRVALNDEADAPRYIETVPRRGYRFIAPVSASQSGGISGADLDNAADPKISSPDDSAFRKEFSENLEIIPAEIRTVPTDLGKLRLPSVLLALLGIGIVAGFAFHLARTRVKSQTSTLPARAMVAVLPFENMSNDPSQDYFSDGMTEETITQLGRLNPDRLGVIARTSAMRYKHNNKGVDEIGRDLHVDYVLEGSVRREGRRVRITAQLIRVSDQSHRWAKNFDRNLGDVLALQAEVACAIASDIDSELGHPTQMNAASLPAVTPAAYDACPKGRTESSKWTQDGICRGVPAADRARSLTDTISRRSRNQRHGSSI